MAQQVIVCPNCKKPFELTSAIAGPLEASIREKYEAEARRRDADWSRKLETEGERIQRDAKKKAEAALSVELKDLKGQVEEKDDQLEKMRKAELALRRQQRELEDAKRNLELETQRRVDDAKLKVKEEALRELAEQHRLKDLEKDKQMQDLRKQIEELRRKSEQGSQQLQGEVLELQLEEALRARFPQDSIEPVAKGIAGADVLQRVVGQNGQTCGTILWESKRTKAWGGGWLQKLKDDQRDARADLGCLVSTAMPKEVERFALLDGIWVSDFASFAGLATALRSQLLLVAAARQAAVGKNEKMEVLYGYLSGPHFRQRVEAIVEGFTAMKADLDKEKRAMTKAWAAREKQIERVTQNTVGMYGDLQGLIGASLPQIKALELSGEIADANKSEG